MSKRKTQDILLRARKDNLMKSKTLIGLASLLLCVGMASACGETPAPTTSTEPTTTQPSVTKYTVRFLVDGNPIKTIEVEEGQKAVYDGEKPAKAPDTEAPVYKFEGWDRDLELPITADTDINAKFIAYGFDEYVDDFETYNSKGDITDAGWAAKKYDGGWVATTAELRPGLNPTHGEKNMKLHAWRNTVGFKAHKLFEAGTITKKHNAFKFSIMAPKEMNEVNAIFYVPITIDGTPTQVPFKRILAVKTSDPETTYRLNSEEYIEYTIPFSDPNWDVWGNKGTIYDFANYYEFDGDLIGTVCNEVAFTFKGDNVATASEFDAHIDAIAFASIAEDAEYEEAERVKTYTRYTAKIAGDNIVKLELGANNSATLTQVGTSNTVEGKVAVEGKNITFTSNDEGATLVYKGALTNGNQAVLFKEATGAMATAINSANFYAVQVVDDFESYASSGTAWHQGNTKDDRAGFRGAYYQEYLNGSLTTTSPWGASTSALMGAPGEQANLKTDVKHSGNKAASFKISQYSGMRYLTWGLFDGTSEQSSYRGLKFSFWSKRTVKCDLLVNVYYQNAPTFSTRNNYRKTANFNASAAVEEWTHYEIALDANQVYMGFMLYTYANSSADGALLVDDVEIYYYSPYAA